MNGLASDIDSFSYIIIRREGSDCFTIRIRPWGLESHQDDIGQL